MIQSFPFLSIMEHTESYIEGDKSILPSLLKFFGMFQIRLLYHKHNEQEHAVEAVDIKCSNFYINTGLYLKDKIVEETITQFVLN